jgi:Flp pilus assembly protein TadG
MRLIKQVAGKARREDGQAGLELLMVFPTFIFLVLMMGDLGMMMYQWVSVSNAVREGARFGAVRCQTSACTATLVQDHVRARSGGILSPGDPPSCVNAGWVHRAGSASGANNERGDSVIVSARHSYQFLFLPVITVPITSSADMRLERNDTSGLPAPVTCT